VLRDITERDDEERLLAEELLINIVTRIARLIRQITSGRLM
jgi:hypothetical protein